MSEVYMYFAGDYDYLNFDEKSAEDCYKFESQGIGKLNITKDVDGKYNGYFVGKFLMDINISMWKEDIENGYLFKIELLEDNSLSKIKWFIEKILKDIIVKKCLRY